MNNAWDLRHATEDLPLERNQFTEWHFWILFLLTFYRDQFVFVSPLISPLPGTV